MCEYPQFLLEQKPKARKPHKCCECDELINVGQVYVKTTGKWDGFVSTYKHCERCSRVFDWLMSQPNAGCVSFMMLWEEIWNNFVDEYSWFSPVTLPFYDFPQHIQDQMNEWWENAYGDDEAA